MTNYTTALEWVNEWMKANKPEIEQIYGGFWANEFIDYYLHDTDFGMVLFEKENIEITNIVVYRFYVPATKEEFFTVLNILDK